MAVEIVGDIKDAEPIADGRQIRELARLQKLYGGKNWRKKKGVATVRLPDLMSTICRALCPAPRTPVRLPGQIVW